jgi:DNA-binding MarR family transcriptional regulator
MSAMSNQESDQDRIAASLYTSMSKLTNRLRSVSLPKGFTPERLRTLATIQAHGPISVTGLADKEHVRPATMSRMISSLEQEGLIKRREVKHDRRSVLISTTSKGRQMYLRANQEYLRRMRAAISGLDANEVELVASLAALLEQLSTAIER